MFEVLQEPQETNNRVIISSINTQPQKTSDATIIKESAVHDPPQQSQEKDPSSKTQIHEEHQEIKEDTNNT